MTVKEAVSSCLPGSLVQGRGRESPGLLWGVGRGNAEYVTDKESVLGLNKGARTYAMTAINTAV